MKRCPECRRDYYDDTLLYCLDDGNALLEGPASMDEPKTAILSEPGAIATGFLASESPTRAQIHTTDQTAILPRGAEAKPQDVSDTQSERQSPSANRAAEPQQKRNKLLAILGIGILILGGGFFGYRYFKSATSEQINSIAVLPFENKSGDADSEYLSDGVAESLIYRLSQIPDLKVSPRSSVFRYKGKEIDIEKVGAELGVDAVMSGRMVQRGDNLTISVDLVDVRNKKTLWGEQYERKMADLLATQREIASTITEKLQLKLSSDAAKGIAKRYTDNNESYQAYLKGRYFWNRRTAENLKKAIEQFKVATDKDPNFALAFTGLADCHVLLPEYAGVPTSETIPQAKAFATRAIAIDDQLGEPHASLGQANLISWQWAESEREFKRAIELNPNYATAYHWYSHLLRDLGRFDEAAVIIKRGHEIDPLSSIISVNLSEILLLQNNPNASIENTLKIIELDPNFTEAYRSLGLAYLKLGSKAEAITNMEKAVEISNRAASPLMTLGYGYGATGKRMEAAAIAKELEEKYAKKESNGMYVAGVYAGLGDKDKAFEWLEKAFQNKEDLGFTIWRIHYQSLRDDPRYKDLLKRMGLPE